jgi:hypothetical protein
MYRSATKLMDGRLIDDRRPRWLGHHGEHEGDSLARARLGEADDVAPWRLNSMEARSASSPISGLVDDVVKLGPNFHACGSRCW